MAKRVKIPGRLESAETGNIVTGADAVMDDAKGKTQVVINSEVDAAIISLAQGKQDALTFDSAPTEDSPNPVTSAGVYTADKVLSDAIEAILLLIPSAASALNKLVDMQTMNSSIATATASFKGTYNLVSDLHLGVDATHEQIGAALDALSLGADNNDYAFVQVPNSDTAPTEIRVTERYKFNGTNWLFEYDLNNSGFTQGQWNAINSGVTSLLVSKLSDLPTNAELTTLLAGKQDNLTFDNVPTAGSPNPVKSGGVYARNNEIVALINALDAAKQDVLTFDNAPVEGSPNPVKSGGVYTAISAVQAAIVALDAEKQNVLTFDSTPTLGSSNPVMSSGIKTELNRIDGDITTLNDLYEALTQSALVIVQPTDTWPVASPESKTIYRVVDRTNTPPQYYSDYMWNGSTMVLMATYDNAIDDEPTAGSDNLVKSGGVSEAIDHIKLLYGDKLSPFIDGAFIRPDNGNPQSNPDYCYSEKVEVVPGQRVHAFVACSAGAAALAFYSANGTFISAVTGNTNDSTLDNYLPVVPDNASYMRVSTGLAKKADSFFRIIVGSIDQRINSVTNKPLNNIVESSTINGGYISNGTGVIVPQSDEAEYKHIKVHLNEGLYYIDLTYLGSQSILAKYTDGNYNVLDRIVIGNMYGRVNETVYLEDGYYALGWQTANKYYTINDASLIYFGNTLEKVSLKTIGEKISSYYIADNGTISGAASEYNLIRTHLSAGHYLIEIGENYHPRGARYTDNTYSSFVEMVILNGEKSKRIYYLDAGYYAFCSSDSTLSIIQIDNILEPSQTYRVWGSQMRSKYIADGTGVITGADSAYILTKIFLKGKYHIQIPMNGIHPKMWKYTDSTYETPSEPVYDWSSVPVDTFMELNGYYAICNLLSQGLPVITKLPDDADLIHESRLWNRGDNRAFTSIGLKDLVIIQGGTFSNGNLVLTSSGETIGGAYLTDFQCWYWRMAAKVLVTSGMNITMGKDSAGVESFLFTLNADGSYTFELSSETVTGTLDIDIVVGEDVSIVLTGETAATKTATLQVINARGNVFEITRSNGQYSMFGQPVVRTTTNCTVKDFSMDVQNYYDMRNLKVVMWGHSFVEANSLLTDKMQCFTALLGNAIGADKVVNFGRGGFSVYNVQRSMETADKLFHNADYFMFCVGANDTTQTSDYIIEKLKVLIQMTEELGITPILMTISPPKTGQLTSFATVNAWIRNSGYKYVDMEKVFLNANGTINNNVYLDDVHPNLAGHLAIFNRIKLDCPYIF